MLRGTTFSVAFVCGDVWHVAAVVFLQRDEERHSARHPVGDAATVSPSHPPLNTRSRTEGVDGRRNFFSYACSGQFRAAAVFN